jgi:predicted DsbA family dithiol-disulfide isomerase
MEGSLLRLDIFSDPICPWCMIGKAQLDRALEARPAHPFKIEWHPFQLNPNMPPVGQSRIDYLAAKFGGLDKVAQISARVEAAARDAGTEIDFSKVAHIPNTLNAHRLIHWAGVEGRQSAVVSALFRSYWREERDIGDTATLCEIAKMAGMDDQLVGRLLNSDADCEDLMARDRDAREKGVNAVPTYLIAQQYVLSGAQPTELWKQVIDELIEKTIAQ